MNLKKSVLINSCLLREGDTFTRTAFDGMEIEFAVIKIMLKYYSLETVNEIK